MDRYRFSDVPRNIDGDSDNDYCLNGEWWDCKTDSQCPSNQWCNTGTKDCEDDYTQLCHSCSRTAQCPSGTTCISSKCRIAATESGLCYNGKDDDCDGKTDFEDSDCCSGLGAWCSSDSHCCNGVPCDNPVENAGTKCGCPSPMTWNYQYNECRYPPGADCTALLLTVILILIRLVA